MLSMKSFFRRGIPRNGNTPQNGASATHGDSVMRSASFWAMTGLSVLLTGLMTGTGIMMAQSRHSEDSIISYHYDVNGQQWVRTEAKTVLPNNPNGTRPPEHRTIQIFLDPNNPIKEIRIADALVINPSGNISGPLLEINGHEPSGGGNGKINIGTLSFVDVDAAELEVDADVVRTSIQNVVAKNNELDLKLTAVNVVRTGRGGASSLLIGRGRLSSIEALTVAGRAIVETLSGGAAVGESGLRVDRIRIIGPTSGTAFVEELSVVKSSVFGKIKVDNVGIQDLVLQGISLDDGF